MYYATYGNVIRKVKGIFLVRAESKQEAAKKLEKCVPGKTELSALQSPRGWKGAEWMVEWAESEDLTAMSKLCQDVWHWTW